MKRIISSIMAAVMAITMLVSCGYSPITTQTTPDVEIKNIVTAFMDAELASDYDTAKQYVSDDSLLELSVLYNSISEYAKEIYEFIPDEDRKAILDSVVSSIKPDTEYSITNIMFNNKQSTVKLTAILPDISKAVENITDTDRIAIIREAFGFDILNKDALFTEYAERNGLSVAELEETMQKDDVYSSGDKMYTVFKDEFLTYYNMIAAKALSDTQNLKKAQRQFSIYLEQQDDGTWLITNL